jgi:hypothetical protein
MVPDQWSPVAKSEYLRGVVIRRCMYPVTGKNFPGLQFETDLSFQLSYPKREEGKTGKNVNGAKIFVKTAHSSRTNREKIDDADMLPTLGQNTQTIYFKQPT